MVTQSSFPTLTVYKASAGSGKTFRLTIEYIKFLFEDPRAYEGILAVTFTNKATEEMKMRILSTLYGLWKRLSDSDDYMQTIMEETGLTADVISNKSENALRMLLHNYHNFKVQTIDTFFQSVLRNLARELQLSANLRVGLNNSEVIDEAVDEIIDQLANDSELKRLVMTYIEESLSDDKQWNIIGNIKSFGNTIFTEVYKQHHDEMDRVFSQSDFFDNYKQKMNLLKKKHREKYVKIGRDALDLILSNGFSYNDFQYNTSGPLAYFIKLERGLFYDEAELLKKRVVDGMIDEKKWCSKNSPKKDEIYAFVKNTLLPIISNAELTRHTDAREYKSAIETLRHINDVRMLNRIEDMARTLNDTSQRFMLSDTQSLLHEIIGDDDSPFIYEKIGTCLKHVMIDEFQDTSKIQWANFKVLLLDCMSRGLRNLVVGDVKQSIYRFRNGDWRLLNDIDNEFGSSQLEFPPMNTNWRSSKNVISFNNTFFEILSSLEVNDISRLSQEKAFSLKKAYDDVKQEIPDTAAPDGLVNIMMLPSKEIDTMQEHTLDIIQSLMNRGVGQNKIAILLRKAKDIPAMAEYIERESAACGIPVKIVSSEAFRLDASACVRIIINAMTIIAHPENRMVLAALVNDFQTTMHYVEDVAATIFSQQKELEEWLPEEFTCQRYSLSTMSLIDMAEALVRIFAIDSVKEEGTYVTTLFDYLYKHCVEQTPTLEDFLEAWESNYRSKTIETSDVDGVRILTIHKSKGLQFDNVIIPNCNWRGNPPGQNTIWATPKNAPFNELPLVPVGYSSEKSLEGTIYDEDGYTEYIQNAVDNLNLIYVGMTRAKDSLFIIGERNTKSYIRSKAMCEAINLLPPSINGVDVIIDNKDNEELPLILTFGRLPQTEYDGEKKRRKEEEKHKNVFTPFVEPLDVCVSSFPIRAEFRQSNESRRFADDSIDEKDNNRWIRLGTIMHQVFSSIRTFEDIEPVLQHMEFEGTLYDDELTREEIVLSLKDKFNNPQVISWYSAEWTVYNECDIIAPNKEKRPDRVITNGKETIVIDFKFGKENSEYNKQVEEYINLLSDMNMPNVKGFIWYVSKNKIVEI